MFGAAPWLEVKFGLTPVQARVVLGQWMQSFGTRHPRRSALAGRAR